MPAHSGSKSGADMEGSPLAADGKVAALDAVATNALGGACVFAITTIGFGSPHGSYISPASSSDLSVGGVDGRHRARALITFTGGTTA